MTASLTRRYRFSASHRLHSAELSADENVRVYGKCNYPFGHGHDYILEVTVTGMVDQRTGLLLPIASLDRVVDESILRRFRHRYINTDIPEFAELVATTENIAVVIAKILQEYWKSCLSSSVHLARVHVQETDRNGFELLLPVPGPASHLIAEVESVPVHV